MGSIVAAIVAALPGIVLRIIAPILTEEFAATVGRKVLVAAARKIVKLTDSTVDDEIVEDMAKRLGISAESTG